MREGYGSQLFVCVCVYDQEITQITLLQRLEQASIDSKWCVLDFKKAKFSNSVPLLRNDHLNNCGATPLAS